MSPLCQKNLPTASRNIQAFKNTDAVNEIQNSNKKKAFLAQWYNLQITYHNKNVKLQPPGKQNSSLLPFNCAKMFSLQG